MKPIYSLVSVLVLFNAISPLVSASIKIPHKEEENVLEERLSDLFDGLEEDPIVDDITVMEVNSPEEEDDFVTIEDSGEGFPQSLCHPKDLSCPNKVTEVDTLTGEEVEGIIVDNRDFVMINNSKKDPGLDRTVGPEDSQPKGDHKTLSDDKRMGRAINGTKIPSDSPKNESKKDDEGKKQTLLSILQGKTQETVSGGVAKGEELKDKVNEKVVHLNKHVHKTADEVLVPIKERSDELLHHVDETNRDVHEKSKGVLDSVFKMFG